MRRGEGVKRFVRKASEGYRFRWKRGDLGKPVSDPPVGALHTQRRRKRKARTVADLKGSNPFEENKKKLEPPDGGAERPFTLKRPVRREGVKRNSLSWGLFHVWLDKNSVVAGETNARGKELLLSAT